MPLGGGLCLKFEDLSKKKLYKELQELRAENADLKLKLDKEYSENEFKFCMEKLPTHVLQIDRNYKVIWANEFARSTMEGEILLNQYCYEVHKDIKLNKKCKSCPVEKAFMTKNIEIEVFDIKSRNRDYNNSVDSIYYEKVAVPIVDPVDGSVKSSFIISSNITEKVLFNRLKEKYKKSIGEFAVFEREANYSDDELLDSISYEVKASMNGIAGMTQLLENSELTNTQLEWIESLNESTSRLKNVLSNIMNISRYDHSVVELENTKFNLRKLFRSYQEKYDKELHEKKISFTYRYDSKIPAKVIGDKEKLTRVIDSIVAHYIKLVAKGRLVLKAELVKLNKETVDVRFTLTDTSNWIGNNTFSGKNELGLTVAKNMIRIMEGSFKLSRFNDEGTQFEFDINFGRVSVEKKAGEIKSFWTRELFKSNSENEDTRKKILIAEDETIGRLTLEHMLKKDYNLIFAKDGKDAVKVYFSEKPDLVIMDIMMPIMNGFEAYDEIEKNTLSRVPIIACTARVISSEKEYLTSYGFDDYIPKPIDMALLMSVIEKYLGKKR